MWNEHRLDTRTMLSRYQINDLQLLHGALYALLSIIEIINILIHNYVESSVIDSVRWW